MTDTYNGLPIIYSNDASGQIIPSCPISAYSTLSIPAVKRAVEFLSTNLASFTRSVRLDGQRLDVPHPLDYTLKIRPNGYQDSNQLWTTLFAHRAHRGNGYAEIRRTNAGRIELHNLTPETVTPFRIDLDGTGNWQQWYAVAGRKKPIAAAEMIHLCGLSHDGMTGLDPVRLFGETFNRAKMLDRHVTRYLQRGTVLRGAIQIPAAVQKEQLKEIETLLRTYFSGADAERDVIVLSGGATLNNQTLSPQESQIVEQGGWSITEIAQVMGVPPQFLFYFKDSKYNDSIEAMGEFVVRYTFRTLIEETQAQLSLKLLSDADLIAGKTVHLDAGDLLKADRLTQTTTAIALKNAGLLSTNEGRRELGYPDDTAADSDKLKTLGDTTPQAARALPPPAKSSADRDTATFHALKPILDAAIERVETKTSKAFENAAKKTGSERTLWGNVFAEQQKTHVADALNPLCQTFKQLAGITLDIDAIGEKYAGQIRRKTATNEETNLLEIITTMIGGMDEREAA